MATHREEFERLVIEKLEDLDKSPAPLPPMNGKLVYWLLGALLTLTLALGSVLFSVVNAKVDAIEARLTKVSDEQNRRGGILGELSSKLKDNERRLDSYETQLRRRLSDQFEK